MGFVQGHQLLNGKTAFNSRLTNPMLTALFCRSEVPTLGSSASEGMTEVSRDATEGRSEAEWTGLEQA